VLPFFLTSAAGGPELSSLLSDKLLVASNWLIVTFLIESPDS
jgi:hypothetical protein